MLAVEGAHLLLLSHNKSTADYLVRLACQIGQNCYLPLNCSPVCPERHIEPALYLKENVCLSASLDQLSAETTYQIACLLNGNNYDFELKPATREKIKANLNKKEKVEAGRK